jgi:hypothetical protein
MVAFKREFCIWVQGAENRPKPAGQKEGLSPFLHVNFDPNSKKQGQNATDSEARPPHRGSNRNAASAQDVPDSPQTKTPKGATYGNTNNKTQSPENQNAQKYKNFKHNFSPFGCWLSTC